MVKNKIKVSDWITKIKQAEKRLKKDHRMLAKKSEKHYYNDMESLKVWFPIYWSNTQVMRSALFSRDPVPEVRTRNSSGDPSEKEIVKLMEKAISYQLDISDFHSDIKRSVLDYLLVDMGVVRLKYDATTSILTDELGQEIEEITNQKLVADHWPHNRFIYDIGKDWAECDWVCYKHYLSDKEIFKEFEVKIDISALEADAQKIDIANKAIVYEIWDKNARKVYEIMEGRNEPLRVRDDPYQLEQFFDCTKPMISNMRTDKFIPLPDYVFIEKQLNTINMLEERIYSLTKNIRDVGFYDSGLTELKALERAKDGTLVPVHGLMEKLNGASDFTKTVVKMPIDQQAIVVQILRGQVSEYKEQIYEITGISDIVRGNTKASETATAQQIKGQWANVRLQEKQNTINSMLRQLMRMYSEMIGEHFNPIILQQMTGIEVTQQMQQIMNNDLMRSYAIDVETDSTIANDEAQDKQDRNEMLQSVTAYLQMALPAIQQGWLPADMGKELLLVNVRGYKHARNLEDMIMGMDGTYEQMQALQQQIQQMTEQGQQMQMQAQQIQEQAQQEIGMAQQQVQQLTEQLQKVNEREENRKDIEVQGEATKDQATAQKDLATAEKTKVETELLKPQVFNGVAGDYNPNF